LALFAALAFAQKPVLNPSPFMALNTSSTEFTLTGNNFDTSSPTANTVTIYCQGTPPTVTVLQATATELWLVVQGFLSADLEGQQLSATVSTKAGGVSTKQVVTAKITLGPPVVFPTTLPVTTAGSPVTIQGRNFDANTKESNIVTIISSSVQYGADAPTATVTGVSADGSYAVITFDSTPLSSSLVGSVLSIMLQTNGGMLPAPVVFSSAIKLQNPTVTATMSQVVDTNAINITMQGGSFDFFNPSANVIQLGTSSNGNAPVGVVTSVTRDGRTATVTLAPLDTAIAGYPIMLYSIVNGGGQFTTHTALTGNVLLAGPTILMQGNLAPLDTNAQTLNILGKDFDATSYNNTLVFTASKGTPPEGSVLTVLGEGTELQILFSQRFDTNLEGAVLSVVVTTPAGSSNGGLPTPVTTPITLAKPVLYPSTSYVDTNTFSINVTGINFDANPTLNLVDFNNTQGTWPTGYCVSVSDGGQSATIDFAGRLNTDLAGAPLMMRLSTPNPTKSGYVAVSAPVRLALPTVEAGTTLLDTDATTLTIGGTNFASKAALNTVLVSSTGSGTAPAAAVTRVMGGGTQAELTFSGPLDTNLVGLSLRVVLNNGVGSSGTPVIVTQDIVLALPTVDKAAVNLNTDAMSLTITGTNFAAIASDNSVVLSASAGGDAPLGKVMSVSNGGRAAVIAFDARLDTNLYQQTLSVVFTNPTGSSSSVVVTAPIVLAAPTVLETSLTVDTNAATVAVSGTNFHPLYAQNGVNITAYPHGSAPTGVAIAVEDRGQTLVVNFTARLDTNLVGQRLGVIVCTEAGCSGPPFVLVTQPIVLARPTVAPASVYINTSAVGLDFDGTNFDANPASNLIHFFSESDAGSAPTGIVVRVTRGGTRAYAVFTGRLDTDDVGAPLAVQITNAGGISDETIVTGDVQLGFPQIMQSGQSLSTAATDIYIKGYNFDHNPAGNSVTFLSTGGTWPLGVVKEVKSAGTLLHVVFANSLNTNLVGFLLLASVQTSAGTSSMVTVAQGITLAAPSVSASPTQPLTTDDLFLTITGSNFDSHPGNNHVQLSSTGGHAPDCTVVGGSSGNSLTVKFSTRLNTDLEGQILSAIVKTSAGDSSPPQPVCSYIQLAPPQVDAAFVNVSTDTQTFTITGKNFDAVAENNTVVLYASKGSGVLDTVVEFVLNGGTGLVFSTPRLGSNMVGSVLGVVVHTHGGTTGVVNITSPITLAPPQVIEASPGSTIDTNAMSLTVFGVNFDMLPANNKVVLLADNGGEAPVGFVVSVVGGGSQAVVNFTNTLNTNLKGSALSVIWTTSAGTTQPTIAVQQVKLAPPRVTPSATVVHTDDALLTIQGFNFDPTATSNAVVVQASSGHAPVVVGASVGERGQLLTVSVQGRLSTDLKGQTLAVYVQNDGGNSQPAQPITGPIILSPPTLEQSDAVISTDAQYLYLNGTNFEPNAADNHITLHCTGTCPDASVTEVLAGGVEAVVTFTGGLNPDLKNTRILASLSTSAGNTGDPVYVTGDIVLGAPRITSAPVAFSTNDNALTLVGANFDVNAKQDSVTFTLDPPRGTPPTGTVTSVTPDGTTATITLSPLTADVEGAQLLVSVSNGASSSAKPVAVTQAITLAAPEVVENDGQSVDTSKASIAVAGKNFAVWNLAESVVTFELINGSANVVAPTGAVTSVNAAGTLATVSFTTFGGLLDTACVGASLSVRVANGAGDSGFHQITDPIALAAPTLAEHALNVITTDAQELDVNGTSFSAVLAANNIVFSVDKAGAKVPTGQVSAVRHGGQEATITFPSGPLSASLIGATLSAVIKNGVGVSASTAVTAPIRLGVPRVLVNTPSPLTTDGTVLSLSGFNFDPTVDNNNVTLSVDGDYNGALPTAVVKSVDADGFTATVAFAQRLSTQLVGHVLLLRWLDEGGESDLTTITAPIKLAPPTLLGTGVPRVPLTTDALTLTVTGTNFAHAPKDNTVTLTASAGTAPSVTITAILDGGQAMVLTFAERLDSNLEHATLSLTVATPGGSVGPSVVTDPIQLAAPTVVEAFRYLDTSSTGIIINGTNFNSVPGANNVTFYAQSGSPPKGVITEVSGGGTGVYVSFTEGGLSTDLSHSNLSVVLGNGAAFSSRTTVSALILDVSSSGGKGKTALVVGLVVGVVAVIAVGIGCFIWVRRRKQRKIGGSFGQQKVGVVDGFSLLDKDDDDDLAPPAGKK